LYRKLGFSKQSWMHFTALSNTTRMKRRGSRPVIDYGKRLTTWKHWLKILEGFGSIFQRNNVGDGCD